VRETLGGSDGVTTFQRFALKEAPVTMLTGPAGGEPALEVRVGDVRWTRVVDLAQSGPDDRHYRSETDDRGVTTIVFGDGINGAVPPPGSKNVTASYRVGLGPQADAGRGRVSRIRRAHPLLARVFNPTPVVGGTAPAGTDDTRSQATRFIRTFGRAVSVSDLADLALTIPGVARSAARWEQGSGAIVVVATAAGDTPPALDAIRAFLDARRDVTVPLRLRGPSPHDLRVTVEIEADPAYLAEAVKSSVRTSLHGSGATPGMFTFSARGLGQPAYLSEVYQRVDALPGVLGVQVLAFASLTESGVADVIPADVDEWLRLRANDLTVTVIGRAT
jgi:predicted phage baseplate assembly protein